MNKRRYTGMNDAKGRKLFSGDTISYRYNDTCEPKGIGTITGVITFENAAFVVKEPTYNQYDWSSEATRPALLWEWLRNDPCIRKPVTRNQPC